MNPDPRWVSISAYARLYGGLTLPRKINLGRLHFYFAHIPVDGWLPWFTPRRRLRDGAAWLIEWWRFWLWWQ